MRSLRTLPSLTTVVIAASLGLACTDEDARPGPALDAETTINPARPATDPAAPAAEPLFAVTSLVSSGDETSSYVSLLSSLDGATIDYGQAREFAGQADFWAYDGSLFVTELDALTITRFSVDSGELVETGRVSFQSYGITDFGFWVSSFISSTKAYLLNGTSEIIIWNPSDMSITGTLPMPELASRGALNPVAAYADRATLLRGQYLYQPIYWADDTYFEFSPSSSIAVFDTQTDSLLEVIEAPCPGLDFGTQDEEGNLYFSPWVFAPSGAALLEQPATCVVKVAAGESTATAMLDIASVTDGREGGELRYLGNGQALLAVFHPENSQEPDVQTVAFGANWRFWSYDLRSNQAALVEGIDWNAGAAYSAGSAERPLLLVPAGDYSATSLYDISEPAAPRHLLDTRGWSLRVFQLR